MLGKDAVVVICDGRSGLVRLDGELCRYRARDLLAAGDRVPVVEIDGLTVVVRRATSRSEGAM